MSFLVRSVSPIDSSWELRKSQIFKLVGPCKYCIIGVDTIDQGWEVHTFEEALYHRKKLERVPDTHVTIQETITEPKKRRRR